MALTRVAGQIRIGHVYECDFGRFKKAGSNAVTSDREEADTTAYDYRIPNEMVKRRAAVVIGKHRGLYLVVPVSSTYEGDKKPHKIPENTGMHVPMGDDFPETQRYEKGKQRWAKCNLVQSIDGGRLTDIYDHGINKNIPAYKVSEETLLKIRYGVMISRGRGTLVPKADAAPAEAVEIAAPAAAEAVEAAAVEAAEPVAQADAV